MKSGWPRGQNNRGLAFVPHFGSGYFSIGVKPSLQHHLMVKCNNGRFKNKTTSKQMVYSINVPKPRGQWIRYLASSHKCKK